MKIEVIRDEMFPPLSVALPEFRRSEYSFKQYLEDIIQPHPDLTLARVSKRLFGYTMNGCISGIDEPLMKGGTIKTMAVESPDIGAALKAKKILGLEEYENVNYMLAIKRILGRAPLPE